MTREPGFYVVKVFSKWDVWLFYDYMGMKVWKRPGSDLLWFESDIQEIIPERIKMPDEA